MTMRRFVLTTRCGRLGVGKEDDSRLALVDESLQGSLLAIIGLDLAAEAVEGDDISHGWGAGLGGSSSRGLLRLSGLAGDNLLGLGNSLGDL